MVQKHGDCRGFLREEAMQLLVFFLKKKKIDGEVSANFVKKLNCQASSVLVLDF